MVNDTTLMPPLTSGQGSRWVLYWKRAGHAPRATGERSEKPDLWIATTLVFNPITFPTTQLRSWTTSSSNKLKGYLGVPGTLGEDLSGQPGKHLEHGRQ